jgi:RNA-directed DNA polymerase
MADSQPTRQQLYDRIKGSSKESVVLEEMKRLGFWKKDEGVPSPPEILIHKEASLLKELNQLVEQQQKYKNKEQALKEIRKLRREQSRFKREENKRLRKQKREEKAARWKEQKTKDIIYLGEDVSKGLNNKVSDVAKLGTWQLPVLQSVEELAREMQVTVGELRFLGYNRAVSKTSHYRRFYIAKKTGGKRLISAPMPRLKEAQYWILVNILEKIVLNDKAHGFVPKRSIVTNAQPHVKAELVINIDLKDFFPSIHYPRVKGLFQSFGYSEQLSTLLGLICTEPDCDQIELDGTTYYVAGTERFLPQGAPTSPAITNIICRKLDSRLTGITTRLGFNYTRYADDLTFSASGEATTKVKTLLGFIRKIVKEEGLMIHPQKFRVLRKGSRKEVTGLVVNDKPGVNAKELDRFRALLYQIEKDKTLQGKHWKNSPHLLASMKGYASYVAMVDPVKGKSLVERTNKILAEHGFKHVIKHKPKPKVVPGAAPAANAPANKKPWWKFW